MRTSTALAAMQLFAVAALANPAKRGISDGFAPQGDGPLDADNNDHAVGVNAGGAASAAISHAASIVDGLGLGDKVSAALSVGVSTATAVMKGPHADAGPGPAVTPAAVLGDGHEGKHSGWGGFSLNIGGKGCTANDHGEWSIGSHILTPGGTVTASGTTIVIETKACTCAIINGETSTFAEVTTTSTSTESCTTSTTAVETSPVAVSNTTSCETDSATIVPVPSTSADAIVSSDVLTSAVATTTSVYVVPSANATAPTYSATQTPLQQEANAGVKEFANVLLVVAMPVLALVL